MFKGLILSEQVTVVTSVSMPEKMPHGAVDARSLSEDCRETQGDEMNDNKIAPDWLRPLQKTIITGASAIIVTLVAVPVWLYEQGQDSLVHLDKKIDQVEVRVVEQLGTKIDLVKAGAVAGHQQLDQKIDTVETRLTNVEHAVADNGKAISRVEGALETVISLLEKR